MRGQDSGVGWLSCGGKNAHRAAILYARAERRTGGVEIGTGTQVRRVFVTERVRSGFWMKKFTRRP